MSERLLQGSRRREAHQSGSHRFQWYLIHCIIGRRDVNVNSATTVPISDLTGHGWAGESNLILEPLVDQFSFQLSRELEISIGWRTNQCTANRQPPLPELWNDFKENARILDW